jgi:hypothetical protein
VCVAPITEDKRFAQVAHSYEISAVVVQKNSVSELEGSRWQLRPRPEANVSLPRIDVWVVNFSPAGIPDLERLLECLELVTANLKLSAQPLRALRLCGECFERFLHRQDTEDAETTQRKGCTSRLLVRLVGLHVSPTRRYRVRVLTSSPRPRIYNPVLFSNSSG